MVETCLHLRHFYDNPLDKGATCNNNWLELSPVSLAGAAIKCGDYTTALLFLELGLETSHSSRPRYLSDQESILFEIYSHIEEPDGFYGIKSHDVARFLVRRFRHENEWDKAFRFDGAALESAPINSPTLPGHNAGVVQALHATGLDNLAVAIQQRATSDSRLSLSNSTDVELAWRTENWDLPVSSQDATPGVSLFCALRAVHREGDRETSERIVQDSIRQEIGCLRGLTNESMTDVRSSVRRLLCLREVKEWNSSSVQDCITAKDWNHTMVSRWGRMDKDWQ